MHKLRKFWDDGGSAIILLGVAAIAINVGAYLVPRTYSHNPNLVRPLDRLVIVYPEFHLSMTFTNSEEVAKECTDIPFLDNGVPSLPTTKWMGCWDPNTRQIWVDWKFPLTGYHELCHASGRDPKACVDVVVEVP